MLEKISEDMFKEHKPLDTSDPGFTIQGWELRWLGAAVAETRVGRPWAVIKKANFPKKIVDHILDYRPMTFAKDDAYRRGDLVLAAAPKAVADQFRKEKHQKAKEAMGRIQSAPGTKTGSSAISVEESSVSDHTKQMIDMFQKQQSQ
jgi:hypothetical protein